MAKILIFLTQLMLLAGFVCGQTTAPVKADDAAVKLEKEAIEFLRETSLDVGRLRTAENRISFNSELASLMWFHDDKEARVMYGAVINDFNELLTQFNSQMNLIDTTGDDEMNARGGLFGGYGKTKVERKFRIAMAVRQQIAMSLAEHAPDLAYNFFYDSLNLISNPEFRKQTEQADKYFESQLIKQIAETDAAKATEYGKHSLKDGVDSEHIALLEKIYAKDPEKAIDFGAAILSRMRTGKSGVKNSYVYDQMLSFGSANLEASKKPGGKKAVFTRDDLHDIADQFARFILDSDNEMDLYGGGPGYADLIEKFAPGRGVQIKAKFKGSKSIAEYSDYGSNMANRALASKISGVGSNSNSADPARAAQGEREKAEKQVMEDVKSLATKPLSKEERDKVVDRARKIIAQTPGTDKKIVALSMLAAQVANAGDKELAGEIMRDAERLLKPEPVNYQDYLYRWMLVGGYTEVDPDKAFPMLENTILRANETISAFVKVAEFIDINNELIDNGEVQVGMFGGAMIRELTGQLGMASGTIRGLAKADFAKTRNLTNIFDRTETRVLAKMLVLRAVLDKRAAKAGDGVSTETDPGDGADASMVKKPPVN